MLVIDKKLESHQWKFESITLHALVQRLGCFDYIFSLLTLI